MLSFRFARVAVETIVLPLRTIFVSRFEETYKYTASMKFIGASTATSGTPTTTFFASDNPHRDSYSSFQLFPLFYLAQKPPLCFWIQ